MGQNIKKKKKLRNRSFSKLYEIKHLTSCKYNAHIDGILTCIS